VSPRTRIRAVVALAALAAAGIAVGAALHGRAQTGDSSTTVKRSPPPLELSVLVGNDAEARALRAAERTYDRGARAAAKRQFGGLATRYPSSVEAAVGSAIAEWPEHTLETLRSLANQHPDSALVRLHLGLALYSAGQDKAARAQWREAKRREPDSPSALRAEDLLHPDMAPGRPFFFPASAAPPAIVKLPPAEQLQELRRAAARGDAEDNLLYGVALQRIGRPVSALAAFDHALAVEPQSVAAQVAAAVGRFDKDEPAAAFSRLGPLARAHPRAAVVRFHLGLLLLWIRDVKDARTQLQRAADVDRRGIYGRDARGLLSRLELIGT
jgi:tetratricopeptide (TPR) repeat protein